tara:strand:+ start:1165 stop:1521 length:357 start_codon:yes stop_codon:yes gene_type:complete
MNEYKKRQIAVIVNDEDLRPILRSMCILIIQRNNELREKALNELDKEVDSGSPSDIIAAMANLTSVAALTALEFQDLSALVHQMVESKEEELLPTDTEVLEDSLDLQEYGFGVDGGSK